MSKIIGIICEFNPYHAGHAYQTAVLRHMEPDAVIVCVMSGAFVQRGEPAICSKFDRAAMAVSCGADLVLELPFPWSMAPAELFARGGVSILGRIGTDAIAFGTEGDVLPSLHAVADVMGSEIYAEQMQMILRTSSAQTCGYPALRGMVLENLCGASAATAVRLPNNALGVEYLRACRSLGYHLQPLAVPRTGAAHDAIDIGTAEPTCSAAALRSFLHQGQLSQALAKMPLPAAQILSNAAAEGHLVSADGTMLLLHHYRSYTPEELSAFAGLGGGLAGRFCKAAQNCASIEALLSAAATKRYTTAHLRRSLWHGFFGTRMDSMQTLPPYTMLLAATVRGTALLRRASENMDILSRPSEYQRLPDAAKAAFCTAQRAENVQAMLFSSPISAADLMRQRGTHIKSEKQTAGSPAERGSP